MLRRMFLLRYLLMFLHIFNGIIAERSSIDVSSIEHLTVQAGENAILTCSESIVDNTEDENVHKKEYVWKWKPEVIIKDYVY